jgi:hypothetical protein
MIRLQAKANGYPTVDDDLIEKLFDEFDSDRSGSIDNTEWDKLAGVLTERLSHDAKLAQIEAGHKEAIEAERSRANDEHRRMTEDLQLRHDAKLAQVEAEHKEVIEKLQPVLLSRDQAAQMIRRQAQTDGYPSVDDDLIEKLFVEFDSDRSGLTDGGARVLARLLTERLGRQAELSQIRDERDKATIGTVPQIASPRESPAKTHSPNTSINVAEPYAEPEPEVESQSGILTHRVGPLEMPEDTDDEAIYGES